MSTHCSRLTAACLAAFCLRPFTMPAQTAAGSVERWSIGYWTPWGSPPCPVSEIAWTGLTHVVHFSAFVNPDGTLDLTTAGIAANAAALIAAAHSRGVRVLLGVSQPSGEGTNANLQQAASTALTALLSNIVAMVNRFGYDGVDLDWEPFDPGLNGGSLQALAAALRTELGARLLTACAVATHSAFWASAHENFDRVNIMTYDFSNPSWDSFSWHNAALYNTDGRIASIDSAVALFLNAGVPSAKLGIGIPFFGWKWSGGGITGPRQHWPAEAPPSLVQLTFQQVALLIRAQSYRWDLEAGVPYLSIGNAGSGDGQFVAYDNPESIKAKVNYAIDKALGGWIIWHLAGDYLPQISDKHPLLSAIRDAVAARHLRVLPPYAGDGQNALPEPDRAGRGASSRAGELPVRDRNKRIVTGFGGSRPNPSR